MIPTTRAELDAELRKLIDAHQRARAPQLHETLQWMRESFAEGHALKAIELIHRKMGEMLQRP